MDIRSGYTAYSGAEAMFPAVARDLRQHFPNFDPLLTALERPHDFKRALLWRQHVLTQLTFSYLKQEYLAQTVRCVLDELPPGDEVTGLERVRGMVDALVSNQEQWSATALGSLSDATADMLRELEDKKLANIHEALNHVGRWCFGPARANRKRVEQSLAFLGLCINAHMSTDTFCLRMREALSFGDYIDEVSLKERAKKALIEFQADLEHRTTARTVFVCRDIKMHGSGRRIGPALFCGWQEAQARNLLNPNAENALDREATNYPFATLVTIETSCHPADLLMAVRNAEEVLDELLGFLVALSQGFHPARSYGHVVFVPDERAFSISGPTGSPASSVLIFSDDRATYLAERHDRFITPAMSARVDRGLRERFRRALRSLRRSAFSAGCHEFAQAYSAAWQAFEVVFGGLESRDRGPAIARRVSALAVDRDALASNDVFEVSPDDLLRFAGAWKAGEVAGIEEGEIAEALHAVLEGASEQNVEHLRRLLVGTDAGWKLHDWKAGIIRESASSAPPDVIAESRLRRLEEMRWRLDECYKLRNDIVHGGYADEGVCEVMYGELAELFGSVVLNLAYNCQKKTTYAALLDALDQEWSRAVPHGDAAEELEQRIRLKAFALWDSRGRPMGDDWTDWFAAQRQVTTT